jgi:NADH-quinone oxidoreductase subunit I
MLRCIFCGLCEEACPKEAIFLTDRIVPSSFERDEFVYGKDKLVETIANPVDVTKRQTPEVLEFKKDKKQKHNLTFLDKVTKTFSRH